MSHPTSNEQSLIIESSYYYPQLNILASKIKDWREAKGFQTDASNISEKLMLLVDEVSEMHEDVRSGNMVTTEEENGKPVGFPSELADVFIRGFDLASALGINIALEIARKMEFNETRPHKHGRKF